MKHLIAITVIAFVACPLSITHARCYVPTPAEALVGAQAVFVGKVISVSDPGFPPEGLTFRVINLVRPVRVRFAVENVYRGRKLREIEVETKTGGLEWGYDFKVGETYLVYAQEAGDKEGGLVVKGCGRSRLVKEATEDLKLLKAESNSKTTKSSQLILPVSYQSFQWGKSNNSLDASGNRAPLIATCASRG